MSADRAAYMREWRAKRRGPVTEPAPTETPCGYRHAHGKVTRWRGRAVEQTCPCGQPAEQWAYLGDSDLEQTGWVEYINARGTTVRSFVAWSPRVTDYQAMCIPCHREFDK